MGDKRKISNGIKTGKIRLEDISLFLEKEKEKYIERKADEYMSEGYSRDEAINKASQSWRTYIGHRLQDLIIELIKHFLRENKEIKVTKDANLKKKNLSKELDLVRRMLLIHFDNYSFLPDADIILYTYNEEYEKVKIIAIISVKNSFRERGFETTYWKLKLKENPTTRDIKVFLATPDKDGEISYIEGKKGARKIRVVLEYELDGIYILKEDFEKTEKVKSFESLILDLINLSKEVENAYL